MALAIIEVIMLPIENPFQKDCLLSLEMSIDAFVTLDPCWATTEASIVMPSEYLLSLELIFFIVALSIMLLSSATIELLIIFFILFDFCVLNIAPSLSNYTMIINCSVINDWFLYIFFVFRYLE